MAKKHKHCMVRSTRHALSDCSNYTEHDTPCVLLSRLDSSVFGLAGCVRMRPNSDKLFDHLGIFFYLTSICLTLESFDIRGSTIYVT